MAKCTYKSLLPVIWMQMRYESDACVALAAFCAYFMQNRLKKIKI